MMLWIRNRKNKSPRRSAVAPRARLNVESLETRAVPAATPYLVPTAAGVSFTPILTTGDSVGNYTMAGTPDGLGAFDNGDGTFTLLMGHEFALASSFGGNEGVAHTHNASLGADGAGSYIDRLVIRKSDLKVLGGGDQMQKVFDGATGQQIPAGSHLLNFSRFCSADLPAASAFYNAATGKGSTARIFLDGEETTAASDPVLANVVGRAMAHIVTGPNNGNSYTLPLFGRHAWENLLANPASGNTTLVIGNEDDTLTTSKVFIYVGTKQSGDGLNEIQKAGLTNGTLSNLKDNGDGTFSLVADGTGSTFARPEDGAWDPSNPNDYYFVTTSNFAGNSQLYKLHFNDLSHPEQGGTIEVLINGQNVGKMFDNITINKQGQIVLQEDVGNNPRLGKVWMYDTTSKALIELGQHNPDLFTNPYVVGSNSLPTQDEESSGVIDVSDILGEGKYLLDVQAHYPNANPALVEGGQLLLMQATTVAGFGYEAIGGTSPAPNANNTPALVVLGSTRNNDIEVEEHSGSFAVDVDGTNLGTFVGAPAKVIVSTYGGNDQIDLGKLSTDAAVYAGAGNDEVKTGKGDDFISGGDGNDNLDGGDGTNTYLGGLGNDEFVVGPDDVILDFGVGHDSKS